MKTYINEIKELRYWRTMCTS